MAPKMPCRAERGRYAARAAKTNAHLGQRRHHGEPLRGHVALLPFSLRIFQLLLQLVNASKYCGYAQNSSAISSSVRSRSALPYRRSGSMEFAIYCWNRRSNSVLLLHWWLITFPLKGTFPAFALFSLLMAIAS